MRKKKQPTGHVSLSDLNRLKKRDDQGFLFQTLKKKKFPIHQFLNYSIWKCVEKRLWFLKESIIL